MEGIGVDVGGTRVRAARVAPDGRIVARLAEPVRRDRAGLAAQLARLIDALRGPDVAGIGIGIPGRVDAATGAIRSAGHLDVAELDLPGTLGAATGLPVRVQNDATMALVAEGAARGGTGLLAMLTVGTGIGGAVLRDGAPWHGGGIAGQFGHLVVAAGGPDCLCGRRGCVETMASGTALAAAVAGAGLPPGTTAEALLAAADAGDAVAATLLDAWAWPMRRAIETLVAALDPAAVILGGGLGAAMVAALARLPVPRGWFALPVEPARLGDEAGVVGAGLAGLAGGPAMKRAILVNGVPASGKSTLAARLTGRLHAAGIAAVPLTLDVVKEALFVHLGTGDRDHGRLLGRASYRAIFDSVAAFPPALVPVIDAWHGFQPPQVLHDHLARAGVERVVEVWCAVAPDTAATRYRARAATRHDGHLPASYADELVAVARRAGPTGLGATVEIDTGGPVTDAALDAVLALLGGEHAPRT